MQKVKALHVLDRFDQGGIENFILNLFENIDRNEFEFHFAIRSGKTGVMDEKIIGLGGQIHYLSGNKKKTKDDLTHVLREFGPFDVVHSHLYFFSGYLLGIAKKEGVPIRIAHCHETYKGQKYTLSRKLYERYMRTLINRNATHKIGCSMAACRHLYGKKATDAIVVHNAIDLEKYRLNKEIRNRLRHELNVDKKILIGHVGRFEDQKDHNFLIDIFNKVHHIDSRFHLLLIGTGSLKQKIIEKVHDFNLDNSVTFLENRQDVNELMQAMDIFVFPSKYEGLSIVEVEAQAAGLNGIVSSSISNEANVTGTLHSIDKNKPNEWVNEILSLKTAKRFDNLAALRLSKYDIQESVDQISEIYKGNV